MLEPFVKTTETPRCVFCGSQRSLQTVLGRKVCSLCWDTIARIALGAVQRAVRVKFIEVVEEIELGE